jgi:CPA1 family monovalent cation:H+ antiporter
MHTLWPIIGLILGVLAVTGLSVRWGLPAPILLLVVGFAVSFIPGVPPYDVDPEIVLFVLLPPLLYAAAVDSGVVAIKRLISPILRLAFGMVLISAFAVAFVLQWVIPQVPFAAALALGAIVAPPDAVAAVAVGRRVGLPRGVMTILEGESLLNDATSLITLRVSIAALAAGSFAWAQAIGQFAWAVVGGALAGLALGWAVSLVRRNTTSALTVTSLSLITPFAAYLLGEEIHASGVLTVVVAGLFLGFRAPMEVPARVRLTEGATWSTLRYVLEGSVFAIIGLQLWAIVDDVDTSAGHTILAILAVLLTVLVIRPIWVFLSFAVWSITHRRPRPGTLIPRAKPLVIVSWAGMRGVVSLAAAQTLPLATPYRSLLLICTVAVIVGTLVLQGLSLPWVIRMVNLPGDPEAEVEAERELARSEATAAIDKRINEIAAERRFPPQAIAMMQRWAKMRDWRSAQDDGDGRLAHLAAKSQAWQREIVRIQRDVYVLLRNDGRLSEEVLRELQLDLDLEEALIQGRSTDLDQGGGDLIQTMVAPRARWDPDRADWDALGAGRGARPGVGPGAGPGVGRGAGPEVEPGRPDPRSWSGPTGN